MNAWADEDVCQSGHSVCLASQVNFPLPPSVRPPLLISLTSINTGPVPLMSSQLSTHMKALSAGRINLHSEFQAAGHVPLHVLACCHFLNNHHPVAAIRNDRRKQASMTKPRRVS